MRGAGFPPVARLRTAADFARLRQVATRQFRTPHFRAVVAAGPAAVARLGLAVSRKVSPHAVERNRIKRVARESFRNVRTGLPAIDVLLIPSASAAACGNATLRADLDALWQRVAQPPARR
jgi:ribonuclease P protein component